MAIARSNYIPVRVILKETNQFNLHLRLYGVIYRNAVGSSELSVRPLIKGNEYTGLLNRYHL